MSSKPFRFHPEAREEFRDAARWYQSKRASAAAEFRRAVSDAIREIVQTPRRWPTYLHGTHRFVLQQFPFSIVYLYLDELEIVTIIAAAHSKRKPGYWKGRV
jgi:toxin ParE1/3/4